MGEGGWKEAAGAVDRPLARRLGGELEFGLMRLFKYHYLLQ